MFQRFFAFFLSKICLGVELSNYSNFKIAILKISKKKIHVLALKHSLNLNSNTVKQLYKKSYFSFFTASSPIKNYYFFRSPPCKTNAISSFKQTKTWINTKISPYLHKNEKLLKINNESNCTAKTNGFTTTKIPTLHPHEALRLFIESFLPKLNLLALFINRDQTILVIQKNNVCSFYSIAYQLKEKLYEEKSLSSLFYLDEKAFSSIFQPLKIAIRLLLSNLSKAPFNSLPLFILGDLSEDLALSQRVCGFLGFTSLSIKQKSLSLSKKGAFCLAIGAAIPRLRKKRYLSKVDFFFSKLQHTLSPLSLFTLTLLTSFVLLVNFQGTKHVPSKKHTLTSLYACSINAFSKTQNKFSTFYIRKLKLSSSSDSMVLLKLEANGSLEKLQNFTQVLLNDLKEQQAFPNKIRSYHKKDTAYVEVFISL